MNGGCLKKEEGEEEERKKKEEEEKEEGEEEKEIPKNMDEWKPLVELRSHQSGINSIHACCLKGAALFVQDYWCCYYYNY